MVDINLILLIVAAIVGNAVPIKATASATVKASSMPEQMTDVGVQTADHPHTYRYNMAPGRALHDNRWIPLDDESTLHKSPHRYGPKEGAGGERRSYRSSSSSVGLGAILNGLTNLSGLGHISNGYGSVAPTHTEALTASSAKQEIPIHEEQHEDAAVAAVAATAHGYGDGVAGISGYNGGEHIQQQQSSAALHSGIYNFAGGAGYQSSWMPSSVAQHQDQSSQHYAYDKISVGNFLNNYDHNTAYEAFQQHHGAEQHQQQQQSLEDGSYFPSQDGTSGSGSTISEPVSSDYDQHTTGEDQNSNFLAESGGHDESHGPSHQSHHHVDIINYVPVKHVKKQHVPVEKPVKIPISHAVIIPIKKPVPIHIPITKQVQVAVEKELRVPVERLVPVPVEKHVPVTVEKRVPYTVIKYMPIKVPKPFPVKVPVFKTVLHKVKSWW